MNSENTSGVDTQPSSGPRLARTLGLFALTIYGIGDMLGSGIYALIGKAAGLMGNAIWAAFLVSMLAALRTGLSYASLGSRYPRAAGAAYVTHRAYRRQFLSYVIGLAVMASGLTSMATQSRAFSGYFAGLVGSVPAPVIIIGFVLALSFVNFWGMRESSWLNLVCTSVEVCGLAIIIAVGARFLGGVNYFELPAAPEGTVVLPVLLGGAVLTFYSFLGFEDMINIIEEVKEPRRTFPRAVVLALLVTTCLYVLVSLTAVSVVPHAELAQSDEPLVEVVRRAAPAFPTGLFSFIALFAITNTALLNYIMGSRLAYGMAEQGLLPRWLGAVHPVRRTPHVAIGVLMVIVLALALIGNLKSLAAATSVLLLCVFIVINVALVILKRRPGEPAGQFEVPTAVPVVGALVCAALLLNAKPEAFAIAGALLVGIVVLYFVLRPEALGEDELTAVDA